MHQAYEGTTKAHSTLTRLTAKLGGLTSRRAIGAAAAAALTSVAFLRSTTMEPDALANRRDNKPAPEGPCGDGSGKDNRCKRNRDCCTNFCDTGIRRCRYKALGESCGNGEQCRPRSTCIDNICVTGSPVTSPTPAPTNTPAPAPSWTYASQFGTAGSGPSNLDGPYGLCMSSNLLTMWVTETANNRVSVWTRPNISSSTWTSVAQFGTSGSGLGNLGSPTGVTVSSDTLTAYVTDFLNDRVSIWTRPDANSTSWSNVTTFGTQGFGPSNFVRPNDVALTPDELTLLVTDGQLSRVCIWSRPDTSSTSWSPVTQFGSNGNGLQKFNTPNGIVLSADGLTAYIADYFNYRVAVWTRPDTSSTTWTGITTIGAPYGATNWFNPGKVFASADQLTVWVTDIEHNQVSEWTRPDTASTTWSFSTAFGSIGSGNSNFDFPVGIVVNGAKDRAWIADNNNDRIVTWEILE